MTPRLDKENLTTNSIPDEKPIVGTGQEEEAAASGENAVDTEAAIETEDAVETEPAVGMEVAVDTEAAAETEIAAGGECAPNGENAADTEAAIETEAAADGKKTAEDTAWSEEWNRHFPGWEEAAESEDSARTAGEETPSGPHGREDGRRPSRREAHLTRRHRPRRQKQHRRRGIWIFFALLSAALLLTAGIQMRERYARRQDPFIWNYEEAEDQTRSTAITIPKWPVGLGASFRVTEAHGDSLTAQEVYKTVNPSVVTVVVNLNNVSASVGTGVIFSADGYMLTNYHVIEGGRDCMAIMDTGYRMGAKYVAGDAESDLAVLKLENTEGTPLPTAVFGDSNRLIVGDPVFAIGNPLGVELRGTMTNGIVSAASRDVQVDGRVMTLIQTNAALNSGNSGGPLINEYGQVVGINVVKMSSNRSTVEGLGFAIPSATMERLINDLLSFGESQPLPSMGLMVEPVQKEAAEGVLGLRVDSVEPDSAAEQAGILAEDFLLSADGVELLSSRDLLRLRNRHYAGEEMTVLLWRNGERLEVTLKLDGAPPEE